MVEIKQVIVSNFAEDDLNEILEYYCSLSTSYVEKKVRQFEENFLSLRKNPLRGWVVHVIIDGRRNFEDLIFSKLVFTLQNAIISFCSVFFQSPPSPTPRMRS